MAVFEICLVRRGGELYPRFTRTNGRDRGGLSGAGEGGGTGLAFWRSVRASRLAVLSRLGRANIVCFAAAVAW